MAVHVVKNDGLLALYNGLSASLCRQVRLSCLYTPPNASRGEKAPVNVQAKLSLESR